MCVCHHESPDVGVCQWNESFRALVLMLRCARRGLTRAGGRPVASLGLIGPPWSREWRGVRLWAEPVVDRL